jgi:Ran GTPase-activating protein (RanGAP) involved in mRNA processing and transport
MSRHSKLAGQPSVICATSLEQSEVLPFVAAFANVVIMWCFTSLFLMITLITSLSGSVREQGANLFFDRSYYVGVPFGFFALMRLGIDVWTNVIARSASQHFLMQCIFLLCDFSWVFNGITALVVIDHSWFQYEELFVLAWCLSWLPWRIYRCFKRRHSPFDEDSFVLEQLCRSSEVDLGASRIGSVSWNHISRYIVLAKTCKWSFSGNVDAAAAEALANALEYNHTVTDLNVSGNDECKQMGAHGVRALARVLAHHELLAVLNLSACQIGSDGVAALQSLFVNPTLTYLNLSHNSLSNRGVRVLVQYLARNSTLQMLDLSANDIGPFGVAALCLALQKVASADSNATDHFTTDDEDAFEIEVDAVSQPLFSQALTLHLGVTSTCRLRHLNLSRNPVGDGGLVALSRLQSNYLTALDVSSCDITDASLPALQLLIASNNTLRWLSLVRNELTLKSVVLFLPTLKSNNRTLQMFHIALNPIHMSCQCDSAEHAQECTVAHVLASISACLSSHPSLIRFSSISLSAAAVSSPNSSSVELQVDNEDTSLRDSAPTQFVDAINRAGVAMRRVGPLMYCGRELGKQAIPGAGDGVCGPSAGPQCSDCRAAQLDLTMSDQMLSQFSAKHDPFHAAVWLSLHPLVKAVDFSLKTIDRSTLIDSAAIGAMAPLFASSLPALTMLDFSGNTLGDRGMMLLADALTRSRVPLTELNVADNSICDAGAIALTRYVTVNTHLRTLLLDRNQVGHIGAGTLIVTVETFRTITHLQFNCIDAVLPPKFIKVLNPILHVFQHLCACVCVCVCVCVCMIVCVFVCVIVCV